MNGKAFSVTVRGRYTVDPGAAVEGDVVVEWKSERPENRLAELTVLIALFEQWRQQTVRELEQAQRPPR